MGSFHLLNNFSLILKTLKFSIIFILIMLVHFKMRLELNWGFFIITICIASHFLCLESLGKYFLVMAIWNKSVVIWIILAFIAFLLCKPLRVWEIFEDDVTQISAFKVFFVTFPSRVGELTIFEFWSAWVILNKIKNTS